jgi:hypothetical protein
VEKGRGQMGLDKEDKEVQAAMLAAAEAAKANK